MTKILDQYGKPIDTVVLDEPQTARIATLQHQYLTPMLGGLTPAKLARVMQEADMGNLIEQHRLFSDMEERDGHIQAEMGKRNNAPAGLDWDIVPPRNATAAEKASAEWVKEVLTDAVDPLEDLIPAMMEGVGHGFSPIELEWRKEGSELLPAFHPRPQEWFRLNSNRTELRLIDASVDGIQPLPFGWIMHTPKKAKTGYLARMGLHRTLAWPFLYKAYALGDFAEFLETYGLPIIVGKYMSGASAEEKASLMRAVAALGHDARAIMPAEMQLEIQKIAGGGGDNPHMAMVEWADKSQSKSILGQTLSADVGSKGRGSYALGKVHNEVRHDIRDNDARQVAATLTRDLVYPLIAFNRGGVDGLRRCPRFTFDLAEAADLESYSNALPKLVGVGIDIPVSWAHEKLHIPVPQDGEAVLRIVNAKAVDGPAANPGTADESLTNRLPKVAALAAGADPEDPTGGLVDQLATATAEPWQAMLDSVKTLVDQATDLTALEQQLVSAYGGRPQEEMVKVMAAAFALAELKGMVAAQEGK